MVSKRERARRAKQSARDRSRSRGRSESRGRERQRSSSVRSQSRSRRTGEAQSRIADLEEQIRSLELRVQNGGSKVRGDVRHHHVSGVDLGPGLPHISENTIISGHTIRPTGLSGGLDNVGSSQPVGLLSGWFEAKQDTAKFKWYVTHLEGYKASLLETHYVSAVWCEIDCLGLKAKVAGKYYLLVTSTSETHAKGNAHALAINWQDMPDKYHIKNIPRHWSRSENFGFIVEHVIMDGLEEGKVASTVRVGMLFTPLLK